jgi:PAS domain S-box-containing protein
MKHADGRTFIGELTGSPTTNGSGVNGTTGSMRDVSERKLSQLALSEAERNLRRITENMSDLVVELDQHGIALYASPSHHRLIGIDPEEVVGRSIFNIIVPEDRRWVEDEYRQWMHRGETKEIEYRIKDRNGTLHWVHSIGTALTDEGGHIIGAIINSRDVTERRRAEDDLHQSEGRLQRAEEVARIGHWTIDLDDLSMIGSRGASKIYGIEQKKWTLKEVQAVPLAQYRSLLDSSLRKLIEEGAPYDVEFKIKRMDDGQILDIHSSAEYDPEHRVVFGVIHDITETKRAQEAMAHSNDLMRYIIEHSRSAIAVLDREMRYLFVSQHYIDDYELKENVVGMYHYDVFPDLPPQWKEVHRRALAGEVISADEESYIKEHGSVYWTRWECRPWFLPDGSIGGIILDTEVINEHRQVKDDLKRISGLLDLATQAGRAGVWEWDVTKDRVTWSDLMFEHHAIRKDEFGGRLEDWVSLTLREDRAKYEEEIRRALKDGSRLDTVLRVRWPDGSVHSIRVLAFVQRNAKGEPLIMSGIGMETT